MRKLMVISAASAIAGYAAVHFAFFAKPTPAPEAPTAVVAPAEPAVLAQVVEVTDTDALLDARPTEPVGVPFEGIEQAGFTAPAEVAPIPRAAD